jgi:hypothetical protein
MTLAAVAASCGIVMHVSVQGLMQFLQQMQRLRHGLSRFVMVCPRAKVLTRRYLIFKSFLHGRKSPSTLHCHTVML